MRDFRPEVLAPAGSPQALLAAVRCGADAVYLGAGKFNARRNAGSFPLDGRAADAGSHTEEPLSLREAVAFCHARGVKVHLALNTLIRQEEMPEALAVAEEACALSVDAVIVQDLGLARLLHEAAPGLSLHASTQLSCHTPAGVESLRDMGFSRVVLSREMSREEIAACCGLGCEIEVFVHGALCMCVSGQCYLSAMLGGRSGNRGLCAQPCRLPFGPARSGRPAEAREAALSLKDLSLLPQIGELAGLGVSSLKIEGRMKRPEYVAAAVTAVRQALDEGVPDPRLIEDVQRVFSRSGFTDGYYTGRRGAAMFGVRRREDVTAADSGVLGRLSRLYEKEPSRVGVRFQLTLRQGTPAMLTASDDRGQEVSVTGPVPQAAQVRPLSPQRAAEQLSRTGGTPFFAESARCDIGEGLTLPLSALNALRRQALECLLESRANRAPIPFCFHSRPAAEKPQAAGALEDPPRLVARAASLEQAKGPADLWFLPLKEMKKAPGLPHFGVEIPRGLFGREQEVLQGLRLAADAGARYALCGNVGAIPLALEAGLLPVGGFGLNITNAWALEAVARQGLTAAVLSMELTFPQMAFARQAALDTGLVIYGRQPLMLMRNCPRKSAGAPCPGDGLWGGCGLTDRKGITFPLDCAGGCAELLNSACLYWADRLAQLPRPAFWYLHFTDETPEAVEELLNNYRQGGPSRPGCTRGLYRRGVE